MLKRLIILIFLVIVPFVSFSQEEVLEELEEEIERSSYYDLQKIERIDSLRGKLKQLSQDEVRARYQFNRKLFEEYQVFKHDSAFAYYTNQGTGRKNWGHYPGKCGVQSS